MTGKSLMKLFVCEALVLVEWRSPLDKAWSHPAVWSSLIIIYLPHIKSGVAGGRPFRPDSSFCSFFLHHNFLTIT